MYLLISPHRIIKQFRVRAKTRIFAKATGNVDSKSCMQYVEPSIHSFIHTYIIYRRRGETPFSPPPSPHSRIMTVQATSIVQKNELGKYHQLLIKPYNQLAPLQS